MIIFIIGYILHILTVDCACTKFSDSSTREPTTQMLFCFIILSNATQRNILYRVKGHTRPFCEVK